MELKNLTEDDMNRMYEYAKEFEKHYLILTQAIMFCKKTLKKGLKNEKEDKRKLTEMLQDFSSAQLWLDEQVKANIKIIDIVENG